VQASLAASADDRILSSDLLAQLIFRQLVHEFDRYELRNLASDGGVGSDRSAGKLDMISKAEVRSGLEEGSARREVVQLRTMRPPFDRNESGKGDKHALRPAMLGQAQLFFEGYCDVFHEILPNTSLGSIRA
jgi:hypothetical protein